VARFAIKPKLLTVKVEAAEGTKVKRVKMTEVHEELPAALWKSNKGRARFLRIAQSKQRFDRRLKRFRDSAREARRRRIGEWLKADLGLGDLKIERDAETLRLALRWRTGLPADDPGLHEVVRLARQFAVERRCSVMEVGEFWLEQSRGDVRKLWGIRR